MQRHRESARSAGAVRRRSVGLDAVPHGHGPGRVRRRGAVCRLKDSGLAGMPFTDWHANSAWAAMCTIGLALVGWFQNACLDAALRRAAPKRLRWELWHLPALVCRTARRVLLRLPEPHPGARALLAIAHPR